jgi:hypothetical protein
LALAQATLPAQTIPPEVSAALLAAAPFMNVNFAVAGYSPPLAVAWKGVDWLSDQFSRTRSGQAVARGWNRASEVVTQHVSVPLAGQLVALQRNMSMATRTLVRLPVTMAMLSMRTIQSRRQRNAETGSEYE